ncbi:MAG: helix-turn-helix domain-containing protein [Pikeienuella sp.]
MGKAFHPGLQGFDSFEVKLGDQLRGERASKGKTLLDVQRELRLRADLIDAIENADASAFTAPGFASGYIRSYARYLNLDPDDVYRRFCAESGFRASEEVSVEPTLNATPKQKVNPGRKVDDLVINNRFAPANARAARVDFGSSLRGLASVAALGALVVGLGFGGWTVLQNLQRVGFAPLPDAPEVLVSAPDIQAPTAYVQADAAPEGGDAIGAPRISLAELYAEQEFTPPVIEPRDGPISSIDPMRAGVYAADDAVTPPSNRVDGPDGAVAASERAAAAAAAVSIDDVLGVTAFATTPSAARLDDALSSNPIAELAGRTMIDNGTIDPVSSVAINIVAVEDAWLRVRDGDAKTLFTGILGAGDRFILPVDADAPVLRAGNAGAVYLVVGDAAFGPLGAGPVVAKNVQLTPEAIRASYPVADDVAFEAVGSARRAAVEAREAVAQLPLD